MGEHTRRRDFDAVFDRQQEARRVGDTELVARLSRELRELAPAAPDPATRRPPARTRAMRRRGALVAVLTVVVGAGLGAGIALLLPVWTLTLHIGATLAGAFLGGVVASDVGVPEGPGPIGGISFMFNDMN